MLKVGITGGIGSGKSVVCQVFKTLGIPVFNADEAARHLMENDAQVITAIKKLFGENIYAGNVPNREKIAQLVFNDASLLQKLNDIVHPAVAAFGHQWMQQQQSPYIIKEAAIFFESGTNKEMDVMIGVYAPVEVRIQRAISRDNISAEKVQSRIANQMSDEEKMKLCDYVITNDGNAAILPQIMALHQTLLSKAH
ncbi:MAG: dephospho-CoA kinase [Bacteroidetes bacterium]|nr:dephospho-CoA kinase [Bacteroidota bacterium]